MVAYRSPKPLIGVRVPQLLPICLSSSGGQSTRLLSAVSGVRIPSGVPAMAFPLHPAWRGLKCCRTVGLLLSRQMEVTSFRKVRPAKYKIQRLYLGEQLTRSERWSEKPEDGGSTPLSPTSREIGDYFHFLFTKPSMVIESRVRFLLQQIEGHYMGLNWIRRGSEELKFAGMVSP